MSIRNNQENLTNRRDFSNKKPIKRDVATCTENFIPEVSQAPVFNIHIHVPVNNPTNTTTMYLPKILPIIHVHFDELTKNLKKNLSQQNEKLNEKHFESIVKEITPKLGNVFLHHENNRHFKKNEMNTVNQKQTLREKNLSTEFEGSETDETVTMNGHNHSNVLDNNERTEGIGGNGLPNVMVNNGHPIKLKKAVVVLKDILKSNSYNSGRIRNLLNCQENESSSSPLNEVANYGPQIKTEPQCSNDDDSYLNSSNSSSFSNSVNSGLPNAEKCGKREILDSLVQGCNFSDILQKFKWKYGKNSIVKLENLLSKSVINSSKDGVVENDKGTINDVIESTQNGVQTKKEAVEVDQSYDIGDKQQGELNYNRDELNLEDGIRSNETENQPCENSHEEFIKYDTEISEVELGNSVTPYAEVVENGVEQMHGDHGNRGLINPFHEDEFMSDDNEFTANNKSSSDVVGDLKNLEFDSSNCISDVVIKSEFGSVELNDLILNDEGDFDLNLVKKEVISPEKSGDQMAKAKREKRNSTDVREDESSPKKIKQSPKTSKTSPTKASKGEDYIPLNIPGPTEFAVVPLSKVQARERHDAKNFKNDMLFGNRVNRFTNAEDLRVYKLKKQAAKTRSE